MTTDNQHRLQGKQHLAEYTAECFLREKIGTFFADKGPDVLKWLNLGGKKPPVNFEACKEWLLSEEALNDFKEHSETIVFSAFLTEQREYEIKAQEIYLEIAERLP